MNSFILASKSAQVSVEDSWFSQNWLKLISLLLLFSFTAFSFCLGAGGRLVGALFLALLLFLGPALALFASVGECLGIAEKFGGIGCTTGGKVLNYRLLLGFPGFA